MHGATFGFVVNEPLGIVLAQEKLLGVAFVAVVNIAFAVSGLAVGSQGSFDSFDLDEARIRCGFCCFDNGCQGIQVGYCRWGAK